MSKIRINISEQKLYFESDSDTKTYSVSTSKFGTGTEEGSNKTPLGDFIICQKIGEGEPERTIFKARLPVGIWDGFPSDADLVLTRILWLDGVEHENSNTKDRFIYIHGTNHEIKIGKPDSDGCIRMLNKDIVELFDLVQENTKVSIIKLN